VAVVSAVASLGGNHTRTAKGSRSCQSNPTEPAAGGGVPVASPKT
jgi:hypothetical protein